MNLPLSMSDVSLWLAVTALILLVTSELVLSAPQLSWKIPIEKKRLRLAALGCGLGFMVTLVIRVFQPF